MFSYSASVYLYSVAHVYLGLQKQLEALLKLVTLRYESSFLNDIIFSFYLMHGPQPRNSDICTLSRYFMKITYVTRIP